MATLTIKGVFDSLAWSAFPRSARVGVNVDLSGPGNRPVSVPAADSYTETLIGGDCTYSNANVLVFTNTAPCAIRVTAIKSGYANLTGVFSVTPQIGIIAIAGDSWGTYPAVTYGTYRRGGPGVGTDSLGCHQNLYFFDPRELFGERGGSGVRTRYGRCRIQVRLAKNGYTPRENIYSFDIGAGVRSPLAGIVTRPSGDPTGRSPSETIR